MSSGLTNNRKPNYKKGGNAGVEGTLYQINLLTIFLLNGLKRDEEWYLSTENDDAGKFDDLVFESPEGDIFLQAKHKKNTKKKISYEDLLSTNSKNDDFSLPKYFFSYVEIKDKFNIENVIICTNNDLRMDAELKKYAEKGNLGTEDLLYYEGEKSTVYTFKESLLEPLKPNIELYYDENLQRKNIKREVITDDNIQEFLESLQFLASYPNKGTLDIAVEKIISGSEYSKKLDVKMVYNFIYKKMQDWFKHEKGVYLTKSHARAFFCEICTNEYCNKLKKFDVYFESNDLPVANPNKKFWHVIPQEDYIVNLLKLYRTLQMRNEKEFLLISPDYSDDMKILVIDAFQVPLYVYLIIACPENSDGFITDEICVKIKDVLDASRHKKCVLLSSEDNVLGEYFKETDIYELVEEEIEYCNIDKRSREKIVRKETVIFQGEDMSLVDLFAPLAEEDLSKYIDTELLVKFITNEKIKVGSKVETLNKDEKNYYIHRTFNPNSDNISEKKICELDGNKEKIILISDSPGMGKSTILTYLAGILKENYPNLWVIKIDVNSYTRVLFEFCENEEKLITVPQLLDSKQETRLQSTLEKKLFSLPGKVLLMIDGVDEISPDYKEIALNLILTCKQKSNFLKIYVTTRPHLRDELERELDVKAFSLNPFSQENQLEFLNKYWKNHLCVKKSAHIKKCETYSRQLIKEMPNWIKDRKNNMLAEVPLQTRMIAEVFQEKKNLDNDELGDWEGCNEFLTSKCTVPKLPHKINLVKLYQLFMSKKRSIFMQDKSKLTGNVITNDAVKKVYNECQLYHQLLALEAIIRGRDLKLMNCYKKISDSHLEEKHVLKLGIVQKINDQYQFMHRTFAEFYVAECLVLELKCEQQNEHFQAFFLDEVLTQMEYYVIRSFLNGFLKKELIPDTTFKAYASLNYTERLYNGDNTFLHNLIEESCLHIFKFLFKCVCLTEEAIDLNRIRESFGRTLLHYASQGHPDIVKLLVEKRVDVNAEDYDSNTPLHDAVDKGRTDIANFLLDNGANVNAQGRNDCSAIYMAVADDNLEMVKLLLARGSDLGLADEDGNTVLHKACQLWNKEIIETLLNNGADVHSKSDDGSTPLHEASQWSHIAVKLLIDAGANVNEQNDKGLTPLHVTAQWNYIDTFKWLIENGGDINIPDNQGRHPVHWAARSKCLDVLSYLLETCDIDLGDDKGNTALHIAAGEGYLDIVTFLIEKGANVNIRNEDGATPLHAAATSNHLDVVQHLVKAGADINLKNCHGRTVLNSHSLHLEMVKFFIDKGIDINVKDTAFGWTPLHFAVWLKCDNRMDYISCLVEAGADLNVGDNDGSTPLHHDIKNGDLNTVRYLVSNGSNTKIADKKGRTSLHKAAKLDNCVMLRYLTETNSEVNPRDNRGRTPLHEACKNSKISQDIVEFLVGRGADINVEDEEGRTPLHDSIASNSLEGLAFLIGNGGVVNVSDKKGETPLLSAILQGHTDNVRLLVESGANVNVRNNAGNTTLTRAAYMGDLDMIKILVENGADVDMTNEDHFTALHVCSRWNYLNKIHYLLENGANVNSEDKDGCTSLHIATRPHCLKVVEYLIENKANVNARNKVGQTPLHVGAERLCLNEKAYKNLLEVMLFLIKNGAEINGRDFKVRTPLHVAAMGGRIDKVQILVDSGADVSLRDGENYTTLDWAVKNGNSEVVNFLETRVPKVT